MSTVALVVIDSIVWASWSAIVGYTGARLSDRALDHDTWVTRTRRVERDGRLYERVRIRRWKDEVPDAGAWFGGRTKKRLGGSGAADLQTFAIETRRAELVHWSILAITPAFVLWNPLALSAAMVGYGLAANVPFIAIQRYNRARIDRVLRRRRRRVPS